MILLLEIAGIAALGAVVWVLMRAARVRPEMPGLGTAALIGLGAWVAFALWTLVDLDSLKANAGGVGRAVLALAFVAVAVLGYRRVLVRLRERARDR